MAFVGWIRGNKTQGSSRGLVQVSMYELYRKLALRYPTNHPYLTYFLTVRFLVDHTTNARKPDQLDVPETDKGFDADLEASDLPDEDKDLLLKARVPLF